MNPVKHRGYFLTAQNGITEDGETRFRYTIYKATPLTALFSDMLYSDTREAIEAAKKFVDEELSA